MEEAENDRLVLTVEEARKKLGISRGLMYDCIRRREIPHIRVGKKRIVIPMIGLQRYLDRSNG